MRFIEMQRETTELQASLIIVGIWCNERTSGWWFQVSNACFHYLFGKMIQFGVEFGVTIYPA